MEFPMLPAIGASLALDAIQSLSWPQSASSQSTGFASAFSDGDDDSAASAAGSNTLSGFSSTQISPGNLNALLDAQGLAPSGLTSALDSRNSTSASSQGQSGSGLASSAYNAVNQLVQSTAVPLGINPFSISA
jgi:hypothetical protein